MAEPVQSFGRRANPAAQPGPVVLPPVVLPPVEVPIVLVVDATSMRDAAAQIQQMVAEAVRAGFAEAMADAEPGPHAGTGVRLDMSVDPTGEQLAELVPEPRRLHPR